MALRTLSYVGGNRWEGDVTFCGKTLTFSAECVGGWWEMRCDGDLVDFGHNGYSTIEGKVYNWLMVYIPSLRVFGIEPEDCGYPEDYHLSAGFEFLLPVDWSACGA